MKTVFLTVGPQGSGKSSFCRKVISENPHLKMVSRDDILLELFGTPWLDPYSGGHFLAHEKMWQDVAECLAQDDIVLILDCWNGYCEEREMITSGLRERGAERVVAWYFTTPLGVCVEWYLEKPTYSKLPEEVDKRMRRRNCESDYELFHSIPVETGQGFDAIVRVNPLDQDFCLAILNGGRAI